MSSLRIHVQRQFGSKTRIKKISIIVLFTLIILIATGFRRLVLSRLFHIHLPPPPYKPKVFYFAITHEKEKYIQRALSSENTWGKICCPQYGIPWYSTAPESRLKNVTVIIPPSLKIGYSSVYYRMLLIWKHVYQHYPNYDWYMRAWDDNFIFPDVIENIASEYDPRELLEIGYLYYREEEDWCFPEDKPEIVKEIKQALDGDPCPLEFMSGGSSSLVSNAMLKKFVENMDSVCPKTVIEQEDVTIGFCFKKLGVSFVDRHNFLAHSMRPNGMLNIYPSDISCKRKYRRNSRDMPVQIATMHYVKNGDHERIYKARYETECDPNVRLQEVEEFGEYFTENGTLVDGWIDNYYSAVNQNQ